MDKILLTAFISALAGFLTAILSIVKLINDKESKTTDYRQEWTESARESLSKLIGILNAQVSNAAQELKNRKIVTRLINEKKSIKEKSIIEEKEKVIEFQKIKLQEIQRSMIETRREIYETYALTRLHFKNDDYAFHRIEQKFDTIMEIIYSITDSDDTTKAVALKEQVYSHTREMTSFAREILKKEWEIIKNGEPAYRDTKKWSFIGGVIMLFILTTIGIHAVIALTTSDNNTTLQNNKQNMPLPNASSVSIDPKQEQGTP